MKITIHRGTDEIGGSCVQISAGGRRIFIDAGLPLDCSAAHVPASMNGADALFISHCHPDHHGLLDQVPVSMPVYMSEIGRRFIEASAVFSNRTPIKRTTNPLRPGQSVQFDDLTITPWLMDHSAPDAFGFFVRHGEKSLFYTGDFRAHGRKQYAFESLLDNLPESMTALVTEGTLLERSNASYPSEFSVEEAMFDVFKKESNLCYVICSAQNMDRLVSIFRAARRASRELVIDIYTAWILEIFGRFHKTTPRMEWSGVRVLAHGSSVGKQYGTVKAAQEYFGDFLRRIYANGVAIKENDLVENPGRYVFKTNKVLRFLEKFNFPSATVVYSLWGGYLRPEYGERQAKEFAELSARDDVRFTQIHTSGHADLQTLKVLVQKMKPKSVIPIHTEYKVKFPEHFDNVLILDDGLEVAL